MANIKAVANGNWSNTSTWDGGILPTINDDVFANTFTVNVDTSFQVLSLRNTTAAGITVGGSFNFNSGSISGSCTNTTANTSLVAGATNLIQVTAITGSVTLSLSSNVTGPSVGNLISHSGNCNFILNGLTFIGGAGSFANCINKTSLGTLIVSGNLTGGGGFDNRSINSSNGDVIITGNVTGGSAGLAIFQSIGNLTIQGNVTGGNGGSINFSGNLLVITGNVTGGTASGAITTNGNIVVNGNIVGAQTIGITTTAPITTVNGIVTGGTVVGISSTTIGEINISGSVIASATANAISSTNANGLVILNGNMFNNAGKQAIYCQNLFLSDTGTTQAQFFTSGSQDRTLYSANTFPNLPSGSNVRSTTSYGPGNELSGSLIMPDPANVRYGVPTDNTTGSALLSAENLFDEIAISSNPVAVRLRNSSTSNTVGSLLTAFKK
jgi:hypothetical protein